MRQPVTKASDLWEILSKEGSFYPKTHDKQFILDLRQALDIPAEEEIAAFLERTQPTTTSFLLTILQNLDSLGTMLSDIYSMFGRHGVIRSDKQVLLKFDFGQAKGQHSFDAGHFKAAQQALENIAKSVELHEFLIVELRTILRDISNFLVRQRTQAPEVGLLPSRSRVIGVRSDGSLIFRTGSPINADFDQWRRPSGDSTPTDYWPYSASPPVPHWSSGDRLGQAMAPLVRAALELASVSERYTGIDALRNSVDHSILEPGENLRERPSRWALIHVYRAQHDHLAIALLTLAWNIREMDPLQNPVDEIASAIEDIIKRHSSVQSLMTPQKALEEFLDLPLWKFRHQIFSVWIVTIVEAAFSEKHLFGLKSESGGLVFAFAETLIAQIAVGGLSFELVSELRTPAGGKKLTGKSRIEGVQPDYVIRMLQQNGDKQVVYVLEAKQYAKSSLQNFSRALHDYAVVHAEAQVTLVNYGPVSASISKAIKKLAIEGNGQELVNRCQAFGNLKPANRQAVNAVKAHIVGPTERHPQPRTLLIVDISQSMAKVLPPRSDGPPSGIWAAISKVSFKTEFSAKTRRCAVDEAIDIAFLATTLLVNSPLDLNDIAQEKRKGAVLLTDAQGMSETIPFHGDLGAIIVLQPDQKALLYVNPEFHWKLAATVASVIECPYVEMAILK